MKKLSLVLIVLFGLSAIQCTNEKPEKESQDKMEYAIVIHGGAGNTSPDNLPEERREEYSEKLKEARDKGVEMLKSGGTALETVEEVIHVLENSPLFNAGKGAVFTHQGTNELDASIMDGSDLNAGAVAGVRDIKNPISAAREVLNNSDHVMLSGSGASRFAKEVGLEIADTSYFYTERRWEALQRSLNEDKNGTVGCVVLDKEGNLAAGTSTGGRTNKKYGRIGDSPIIGAGNYANNNTCAVSATGHGEYFIRYTVAHDISALMEYKGMTLQEASELVINDKLVKANGDGGIIAVDKDGNISMTFNTSMMFRAYAKSNGEEGVSIFK
ncbi:MAG: isoaspartyl peptidase/L-asparaginase family protein [Bacteroidales bacterium]